MRQLFRFGYQQAASCVFAGVVFGLLAVTSVLPLPIARYDALLAATWRTTVSFRVGPDRHPMPLMLSSC